MIRLLFKFVIVPIIQIVAICLALKVMSLYWETHSLYLEGQITKFEHIKEMVIDSVLIYMTSLIYREASKLAKAFDDIKKIE